MEENNRTKSEIIAEIQDRTDNKYYIFQNDMYEDMQFLLAERATLVESVRIRDEELLRIRTSQQAAAHALDNLCVELGFGPNVKPYRAISLIKALMGSKDVLCYVCGKNLQSATCAAMISKGKAIEGVQYFCRDCGDYLVNKPERTDEKLV